MSASACDEHGVGEQTQVALRFFVQIGACSASFGLPAE